MMTMLLFCHDCVAERLFEQPPCDEAHGGDCPDLACTACGAGVTVGVLVEGEHLAPLEESDELQAAVA